MVDAGSSDPGRTDPGDTAPERPRPIPPRVLISLNDLQGPDGWDVVVVEDDTVSDDDALAFARGSDARTAPSLDAADLEAAPADPDAEDPNAVQLEDMFALPPEATDGRDGMTKRAPAGAPASVVVATPAASHAAPDDLLAALGLRPEDFVPESDRPAGAIDGSVVGGSATEAGAAPQAANTPDRGAAAPSPTIEPTAAPYREVSTSTAEEAPTEAEVPLGWSFPLSPDEVHGGADEALAPVADVYDEALVFGPVTGEVPVAPSLASLVVEAETQAAARARHQAVAGLSAGLAGFAGLGGFGDDGVSPSHPITGPVPVAPLHWSPREATTDGTPPFDGGLRPGGHEEGEDDDRRRFGPVLAMCVTCLLLVAGVFLGDRFFTGSRPSVVASANQSPTTAARPVTSRPGTTIVDGQVLPAPDTPESPFGAFVTPDEDKPRGATSTTARGGRGTSTTTRTPGTQTPPPSSTPGTPSTSPSTTVPTTSTTVATTTTTEAPTTTALPSTTSTTAATTTTTAAPPSSTTTSPPAPDPDD